MKNNLLNKRMPTLFAFILLLGSIWATSFLIQKGIITIGRASPETTPENIKISNITDSSFTVSFTTADKAIAAINFGETEDLGSIVYDVRDKPGEKQTAFYSHYINIPNLKPNRKYFFSIISEGDSFLNDGKNYSVSTGSKIESSPPEQNPVYGKIVLPEGSSADDTLIYLTTDGNQTISALSKNTGEYIIPLNSIRNSSLDAYASFSANSVINLEIARQSLKSNIRAAYKKDNAIPTITLSKNYDFIENTVTQNEEVATASSILKTPETNASNKSVEILSPKENDTLTDQKPAFRGTALPGSKVKITIHSSNNIQTEVTADNSGNWTYRPNTSLAPGEHTVTIETTDAFGIVKKITQSFTVFASGTQVTEAATPSATPTTLPTSTPIPTPTTTTATTPTIALSPTLAPSLTIIPAKPTIAATGDNTTSILLSSLPVFFILLGTILLFVI